MGRYIDWDNVIDRYPELNTLGGADELSSSYIVYSEAFVDGILKSHWTPPFSNNNMIVKDLVIDYCYWRAGRFKLENAVEVKSSFFETINLLKSGQLSMLDEAGNEIPGISQGATIYSSTQSYATSFGMDDPIHWRVDSDHMSATQDQRL